MDLNYFISLLISMKYHSEQKQTIHNSMSLLNDYLILGLNFSVRYFNIHS